MKTSTILTAFTVPFVAMAHIPLRHCDTTKECQNQDITSPFVECSGFESCNDSTMSSVHLNIIGRNSAQNAEIQPNAGEINAYGFFNLQSANVTLASNNRFFAPFSSSFAEFATNEMDRVHARFYGPHSFMKSTITCSEGTACVFECGECGGMAFIAEENSNLTLDCKTPKACRGATLHYFGSKPSIEGNGSNEVLVAASSRHLQSSIEEADQLTSDEILERQADVHQPLKRHLATTTKNCENKDSCKGQQLIAKDTEVICSGLRSCGQTTFDLDGRSLIYALGPYSNKDSIAAAPSIWGIGYRSFQAATVSGKYIVANGYKAFERANIGGIAGSDLKVHAEGYQPLYNAHIRCPKDQKCELNCESFHSCENVVMDCSATSADKCIFTCTESHSLCPRVLY